MTQQQEEKQKELERRRRARAVRAAQRKKQQRRSLMIRLGGVAVVAVLVTALIMWVNENREIPPLEPAESSLPQAEATTAPEPETEPPAPTEMPETTTIHIAAAGDLNVTDKVLAASFRGGAYDFTEAFVDVASELAGADLTLLNFEGTLAGTPLGGERSSAPVELAQSLRAMGVDAVQTANSASIRAGILGLEDTINAFYQTGILPVGTFANRETFRETGGYSIVEVEGIRIALVGFTKGMDNLGLPEGSEDCVNILYEDYRTEYDDVDDAAINRVLRRVQEDQPDLTIAMLHWGSEYNEKISDSQKHIRRLMFDGGVDVILGTHPHLVHEIEFDPEAGTLCAYSLGDFYGDADHAGSNYSLILHLDVTRDNLTGETAVTGYHYTPIYTLKPEESVAGGLRVVRIREAMARYEGNFLGKVTEEAYGDMEYALQRLEERTNPEQDEEE